MSRAGNSHEEGYTLVELLAVLAIVVMIISSVPMIVRSSSSGFALKQTGERLRSDLTRLRNQARITGVSTRLVVEGSGSAYRLLPGDETVRLPSGQTLRLKASSEDRFPSNSDDVIEFTPNGTSSGGVLVLGNSEDRVVLNVDWLTGRIGEGDENRDG